MSPAGAWLRGARILASGFSKQAIGRLWAFEDHPKLRHIEQHSLKITGGDPSFAKFQKGDIKVGPANWKRSNLFVCMVVDRTPCDYSDIPITSEGNIDSNDIRRDPRNKRLAEYMDDGMVFEVFPFWVEETYPLIPKNSQPACNQEQQVQEGALLIRSTYESKSCC